MRFAAVSDIHGNLPALLAVLDDIRAQGVDLVVNLGDILSGPLLPAETADFLMARPQIVTIAGNHERQLLKLLDGPPGNIDAGTSDGYAATKMGAQHVQWMRTLPAFHCLNREVLLVHGTPGSDLVYWLDTVAPEGLRAATEAEVGERLHGAGPQAAQASLVLCGHTHVPRLVQSGATLIVNPGSVGLQAYWDRHPQFHRVENGAPHARYALLEQGAGGWQASLRAVAYDVRPMSELAARNGRHDWAYALTTGWLPPEIRQ